MGRIEGSILSRGSLFSTRYGHGPIAKKSICRSAIIGHGNDVQISTSILSRNEESPMYNNFVYICKNEFISQPMGRSGAVTVVGGTVRDISPPVYIVVP